jgi:hypothetical protein
VRLNTLAIDGGTVKVLAGGASNDPAGASKVKTLTIAGTPTAPTAKLDLANNTMVLDYTGASPITALR